VESKTAGRRGHPVRVEVTGGSIGNSSMPVAAAVKGGPFPVV